MHLRILSLLLLCTTAGTSAPSAFGAPQELPPLFQEFCFDCHGDGSKKGGVTLDKPSFQSPQDESKFWFDVWRNLDAELMPPSDKPRPSRAQRAALQNWIETNALQIDLGRPDPGRVTIRRLNREEYRHTIRDLTGVDYAVEDRFPADDTGYGFDTIGDVLNLSPIHLEKYLAASQEIVARAMEPLHTLKFHLVPEGPPHPDPKERAAYTKSLIRAFADKALRRPVDERMLERLCTLAAVAGDFDRGLRDAYAAVLASPRFLFRAELEPTQGSPGDNLLVDEFALASRLSYFLWSSMPDDELRRLAAKGELRSQLGVQVKRMLADWKSSRFTRNFVGQWLQTRDSETVPIQANVILGVRSNEQAGKLFPHRLRGDMRTETEMLFSHILSQRLPAEELLTARYTFVSKTLGEFYGLPMAKGAHFQKVALPEESHRQGILGHGSFLLLTSNPTRTSPVKRGLFLLDNVLGTPA
ncbi:MAG: DUF1592 domain-containing protein, partial [Verrucomicrobia bacterium]|nr:DUF1592 domain-containing protein [Verrucomicrobiota bacterium]